jgi:tetratricopeptide (TPR) repeat protein
VILQSLLEFNEGRTSIETDFMWGVMTNLGVKLGALGMTFESMAWELLNIQICRCFTGGECSPWILQHLADSLYSLSFRYRYQLQYEPALQASQQSFDLWHHLSEISPDVDYRLSLLKAMILHAENLLQADQKMDAPSIAQDATALSHSMADEIIQFSLGSSLSKEDKFKAVQCRDAFLAFGNALSSVNRHLESYAAFMEGFQTAVKLPVSERPPADKDIDSFMDQICKVAEEDQFSLVMLADCIILFRNLARIHPEEFSSQFLWLLHAYAQFSHQDSFGLSLKNLRIFLEPNLDCPPPQLDRAVHIDDFNAQGGIVENAVHTFYSCPSHSAVALIRNIFITHFDQAIILLREVVDHSDSELSTIQWALYSIVDIIPFVSGANRVALLQVLSRAVKHTATILTCWGSDWQWWLSEIHGPIFCHLWRAGLLENALAELEQIIKYLDSCSDRGNTEVVKRLQWSQMNRHFILFDMGRLPEAIQMIQQTNMENTKDDTLFLYPCLIQTGILQHAGRNQEALQLLRRGVANGRREFWTDDSKAYDLVLYFLLAKLAATWGQVGQPEKALKNAEQAAAACREGMDGDEVEQKKSSLVHSLTTLSNCLAAVGRNNEALATSHEAVSIYIQNAAQMWDKFLFTIRKQELGANAFHSLSLRLMTAGESNGAIVNAEKATELYRELVALAPRHLPTLASSLRNLASILWNVSHREEAITACKEAVGIMQKVVEIEVYFLPALANALDQLAGYLTGDTEGASAVTTESTVVRKRFTSLPPQPDFLFEKIELEGDDEDVTDVKEEWETASEVDTLMDEEILPAAATTIISPSDVLKPEPVVSVEIQPTGNLKTSQVVNDQLVAGADNNVSLQAHTSISRAESSSLKISFEVNLNKMDILWILVWISSLVGILSVVVVIMVNRLQ